jgi:DNA-binding MurR/RpiR family transcriptional regulator
MKEGFSSFLHSDFPTIEAQLDAVLPELSRLEAQVAQYMRLHISDLSFETGASLAQKVGVSEVTISRFLKRLGYEGMRGLKRELRSQLNSRSSASDMGGEDPLAPLSGVLDQELAAIRDVYRQCALPEWQRLVRAVSDADRVYVTGFQTVRGVAEDCARRLALARSDVRFLAAHDGMLTEWLPRSDGSDAATECLILIDVVAYAREAPVLAQMCNDTGRSLVIVTDEMCHWARSHTDLVIHARTRSGLFLESTVAITAALNLIVDAVAKDRSTDVEERLQNWKAAARSLNLF